MIDNRLLITKKKEWWKEKKKKQQIQQVKKIHTADPNQDDRQGKQHPILLTFQANQ